MVVVMVVVVAKKCINANGCNKYEALFLYKYERQAATSQEESVIGINSWVSCCGNSLVNISA